MRSSWLDEGKPLTHTLIRTAAIPLTCLVLAILGLASVFAASASDEGPPGTIAEVRGTFVRDDGVEVAVSILVDTALADPHEALAQTAPGVVVADQQAGMAEAAHVRWMIWADEDIPVSLSYNPAGALGGVEAERALEYGIDTWNSAGGHRFRMQYDGRTDRSANACDTGAPQDFSLTITWGGNLPTGVLARTCAYTLQVPDGRQATEMDMTFSSKIKWTTADETPDDSYDFYSTMLHELGHVIGLDHSATEDAVMLARLGAGTQRRTLSSDDVAGIRALYPGPATPPSPSPTARPQLPLSLTVVGVGRD
jgi:hypothetical protein